MLIQFLHSEDDGVPSGGDAGDVKASDVINRYGKNEDAALRMAEKISDLENRLYRLREQKRTLTHERDELKSKTPADGAVVLSKEDALLLESYKALGKPSDLDAALKSKSTAEQDLAKMRRAEVIRAASEAANFKPSVLATLAGDLDLQVKDKDGKQHAVIVADGKETPLDEYAQHAWADFLPALQARQQPQSYDINAGARGAGGATPEDIINANRQRLLNKGTRY